MARRAVRAASVATALAILSQPLDAQVSADSAVAHDSAVARAMATFRVEDPIRVALLRSRFRGQFMGVTGDTVFFGSSGQPPMAFRFNAVDSIWAVGRATRKGALAGGIVGVAAGTLFLGIGGRPDEGRSLSRAVLGSAVGAAGGALLGALIGSRFKAWKRLYP